MHVLWERGSVGYFIFGWDYGGGHIVGSYQQHVFLVGYTCCHSQLPNSCDHENDEKGKKQGKRYEKIDLTAPKYRPRQIYNYGI